MSDGTGYPASHAWEDDDCIQWNGQPLTSVRMGISIWISKNNVRQVFHLEVRKEDWTRAERRSLFGFSVEMSWYATIKNRRMVNATQRISVFHKNSSRFSLVVLLLCRDFFSTYEPMMIDWVVTRMSYHWCKWHFSMNVMQAICFFQGWTCQRRTDGEKQVATGYFCDLNKTLFFVSGAYNALIHIRD